MYKLIIAGSRDFKDYQALCGFCDKFLKDKTDVQIVSGTAKGADELGEIYAEKNGFDLAKFPADWNKYGKKAGYLRNEQMAIYADALIAFWDGKSKGTKHMIDLATKYKIENIIVLFNQNN